MTAPAQTPGDTPARYYGKYQGLVVNNIDPLMTGRVMVQVPDVLGETPGSWALPCVPSAGIQSGMYIVPPIGSQVRVEFAQGDPDYPVWTGGFWGTAADVPALAVAPPPIPPGQNILLQTPMQSTLLLSDSAPTPATGGIMLKSGASVILVNATGIYITNGVASITLTGPAVTVNMGALVVT